jgi:hypothetical protein
MSLEGGSAVLAMAHQHHAARTYKRCDQRIMDAEPDSAVRITQRPLPAAI